MKENFLIRQFKLLRLMNKADLTNDEIYYLFVNHDNKEKVIEKIGLEKILSLEKDRLMEVLKLNLSNETLFEYCFKTVYSQQNSDLIRICYELAVNNLEFFKVLFKVEGALDSLFDSDIKLSDEVLLSEYNGKKILEYWLKRKAETNSKVDFSSLMKNPDIIFSLLEIEREGMVNAEFALMFLEQFKIDNIDKTLLLTKDENGETLLERLLRNNSRYLFLDSTAHLTPEMIKIFLKCNKLDLLSKFIIDNELLLKNFDNLCDDSQKGSYSGTLLSYLLDNNIDYQITYLLNFEAVLVYINKNKLSYLNKKVLQDEVLLHSYKNKTLLDYLYERNINIDLKKCKNPQIFKICFKNKKFDLFLNATDDVLDIIVEDDKTVFDLMLENGIYPWNKDRICELKNNHQDIKRVLSLLKYGYYARVLETSKDILSYEVDSENHKTIFDIIIEKLPNIENNPYCDQIIKTLMFIEFDSLEQEMFKYPIEVWLFEYDTENHLTILDLLLKKYGYFISASKFENLLKRTDILEWLISHGKLDILIRTSKEVLLQKVPSLGNRTILQLILDKTKSKVLYMYDGDDLSDPNTKKEIEQYLALFWNSIIVQFDRNVLSDPEIMYEIFHVTGSTKYFKYPMEKAQNLGVVTHEMVESSMWQTDGLFGPLDSESEALLQEFVVVMKTGAKSDEDVINLAVMSFRKLIMRNDPLGKFDLRRIIEVKRANPNFHMKYNKDRGSCYNSKDCCIYLNNKYDVCAFEHELTHMFHHHYLSSKTPVEFTEILERYISEQDFDDRILLFMKEFYKDYVEKSKRYFEEFNEKYNIDDYTELMSDQFLQILKNAPELKKIVISLLNKGIKGETILRIFEIIKGNLSEEEEVDIEFEYVKQLLEKDRNSYVDSKLYHHFRDKMNITNFLDAISRGHLWERVRKKIGDTSFKFKEHGKEYFWQNSQLAFAEIIATYVSIRKSDNSDELIRCLREIVGDEIIDYLENYYVSQLTLTEERRK